MIIVVAEAGFCFNGGDQSVKHEAEGLVVRANTGVCFAAASPESPRFYQAVRVGTISPAQIRFVVKNW